MRKEIFDLIYQLTVTLGIVGGSFWSLITVIKTRGVKKRDAEEIKRQLGVITDDIRELKRDNDQNIQDIVKLENDHENLIQMFLNKFMK